MVVSHELRTPVTAIRGHVDALREGLAEDADARDASLAVIRRRPIGSRGSYGTSSTSRAGGAPVHARAGRGRASPAARAGLPELHGGRAAPGDRLRVLLRRRPSHLDGRRPGAPDRLQPARQRVRLDARRRPHRLELAADNGKIAVTVSDSGPGIGPAERERIFRPFWSRAADGTGLGLPIARQLAHALGGELALESEVGSGSRFELRLPVGRR